VIGLQVKEAGDISRLSSLIPTEMATPVERCVKNFLVNIKLGLPELHQPFAAHARPLVVLSGGPSVADTFRDRPENAYIATVNKSLKFAADNHIRSHFCGVMDPGAHMVDEVPVYSGVTYFIASIVHPSVIRALVSKKNRITLWHARGKEQLNELYGPRLSVGGGSTMGLRWVTLGYTLGFREFHLHGLDSSFRDGKTHAYEDRRDEIAAVPEINTSRSFIQQVMDFFSMAQRMDEEDVEPITIYLYGSGLLQDTWDRDPLELKRSKIIRRK
jgi:hypothetical protein